jgi:hypothetical protein
MDPGFLRSQGRDQRDSFGLGLKMVFRILGRLQLIAQQINESCKRLHRILSSKSSPCEVILIVSIVKHLELVNLLNPFLGRLR